MSYQRDGVDDAPEFVDTRQAPEAIHAMKPSQHPQPEVHQQPGVYDYGSPNWAPQYPHVEEKPSKKTPRRIAGLPVWGFWLLIGVIGLVVIGASVGGAVGGSLSAKGHTSDQTTTTLTAQPQSTSNPTSSASASSSSSGTSTSSSAQQTADTVYTPATRDCPGSDGKTYVPAAPDGGTGQYTFVKHCNTNSPEAKWDITEAYVQTFELCIDMCSAWNYYEILSDQHPGAQRCVAAVFKAGSYGAPPGNCWIKNSTLQTDSLVQDTTADTAVLQNA